MFNTDTLDTTIVAQLPARFLMVGDLISVSEDPDAILVFTGPSGVLRVKYQPTITYAHGYVPCVDVLAENEFGGIGAVVLGASEMVTQYGREV